MEDPLRSRSHSVMEVRTPSFQVRFIKKLSNIRGKFAGRRSRENSSDSTASYKKQKRSTSLELRQKSFMSQPHFMTIPRSSHEGGDVGGSPVSGSSSGHGLPSSMQVDVQQRADVDASSPRPLVQPSNAIDAHSSDDRSRFGSLSPMMTMPAAAPNGTPGAILHSSYPTGVADITTISRTPPSIGSNSTTMLATETLQLPSPSGAMQGRRSPAPRLMTLPSPPTRFNVDGGSARLSPSVISRHPLPILNLPTIATTQSPPRPARLRPHSRLSSMPALPMEGPDDSHLDADHDNATLAESDEEEEMEGDEVLEGEAGSDDDEEGEDGIRTVSRHSESGLPSGLPGVDSTPLDLSFLGLGKGSAPTGLGELTPTATRRRPQDYFSSKPTSAEPTSLSPTQTPRPSDAAPLPMPRTAIMPPPSAAARPSMYHQASRSMIDLLSPKQDRMTDMMSGQNGSPKMKSPEPGPSTLAAEAQIASPRSKDGGVADTGMLGASVRRQRSMPTFHPNTLPPPYPSFPQRPLKAPVIEPRDEEGIERLPCYTNHIYIAAIMPRKMEFSAPGVQAKDRKWRRVLCVLEGTAFRVYKCPHGATGVSAIGEWWERKVGVGDVTNTLGTTADGRIRVSSVRPTETTLERPVKLSEDARSSSSGQDQPQDGDAQPQPLQQNRPKRFAASLLHPSRVVHASKSSSNLRTRSSTDSQREGGRPSLTLNRPPSRSSRTSFSGSSSHVTSPSPSPSHVAQVSSSSSLSPSSPRSHFRLTHSRNSGSQGTLIPDDKDLLRSYTLQHAESGLGSDYIKRKNVIRVRMEGEQFLLQAADIAAVVDWIEGFQAATNIALDLDERPMPKGPMFPRRRRRRVRRPEEAATRTTNASPAEPP